MLNVNSLVKHIDQLRILLTNQPIDALAINETKIDLSVSDSEISINGYDIVRLDRNRRGGGVCLYIKSNLSYTIRSDLTENCLEIIIVEVQKPHSKPFLLSTWYRPPNSPIQLFDKFEKIIDRIDCLNYEIILLGDLNCNFISKDKKPNLAALQSLCDVYGLMQMIKEPTRITKSSRSLLDVCLTNEPRNIISCGVKHIGISDHSLIYIVRKMTPSNKSRPKIATVRNFRNFDSDKFRNDLNQCDWSALNQLSNPNDMWLSFKNKLLQIIDKHAPAKKKRVRNKKSPWITRNLIMLMHSRDASKRKAMKSGSSDDWNRYRKMRNEVNADIKLAKASHYNERLLKNKGNLRSTWSVLNELTSRKSNNAAILEVEIDNNKITEVDRISDEFNKHFTQIGTKLSNTIPTTSTNFLDFIKHYDCSFKFNEVPRERVLELLQNLDISKATGIDGISASLLKTSADIISIPLTNLINLSIVTGIFPDEWKSAKVTPIFKKGKKSEMSNFRPISVIPVIAKLCERIIYDQVFQYLEDNNILSQCQSGFRSLHSTMSALLEATNEWYLSMDQGLINAVVYIDLAKAFDTVNHQILLEKLQKYGIKGAALKWFGSYLSNRSQQCYANGVLSKSRPLTCGVPQGSILGPLLFLIYINDLPNCLQFTTPRMYADDTNLTISSDDHNEINSMINGDLINIQEWLNANKLSLNVAKTEFMLIGSNRRLATVNDKIDINIANSKINKVESSKSLGVIIDKNLSWADHVQSITKKISSGIGALRRVKPYVPKHALSLIYQSIIQPYFDYCSPVWDNINKELADKLQKLQNRAARIITGSRYDTGSRELLQKLSWKSIKERQNELKCVTMFKILNGLLPHYLRAQFVDLSDTVEHNLRDMSGKLALPTPRTNYLKRSLRYSGASLWNGLPEEMRQARSLSSFKSLLRNSTEAFSYPS